MNKEILGKIGQDLNVSNSNWPRVHLIRTSLLIYMYFIDSCKMISNWPKVYEFVLVNSQIHLLSL